MMATNAANLATGRFSPRGVLATAIAGIYLAYLFGLAGFNRNFARLGVDVFGIPLFVGEAVIGLLALLLAARALLTRQAPFRVGHLVWALAAYFALGSGFAAAGLLKGYGVAALRDFALVYYLVFFVFTLAAVRLGISPRAILNVLTIGSVVGSAVTIVSFLMAPTLSHEHGAPGYQALAAWLAAMWCCLSYGQARRPATRLLLAAAVAISMFTIYLAAYRTLLPAMIASLMVFWAWAIRRRGVDRRGWARGAWMTSAAVVAFTLAIATHNLTMVPPDHPVPTHGPVELRDGLKLLSQRWVRGFERLVPTVVHETPSSGEPAVEASQSGGEAAAEGIQPDGEAAVEGSLSFRAMAWAKALEKIRSSPLVGIGYGPAPALHPDIHCELASGPISNCGNAHNTYLTLAMRMGIPVFLLFVAINVAVALGFVRAAFRDRSAANATPTSPFLAAAYVSLMVYAFMSLFFESPYLSPLYWVVLALMHLQSAPTLESSSGANQ